MTEYLKVFGHAGFFLLVVARNGAVNGHDPLAARASVLACGVMIALAIDANVEIAPADGTMYGTMLIPDCPISRVGLGTFFAAALTSTGTATIE